METLVVSLDDIVRSKQEIKALIYASNAPMSAALSAAITKVCPGASKTELNDVQGFKQGVVGCEFDLIAIDWDSIPSKTLHLIRELTLLPYDPAILVIINSQNPKEVTELLEAGCSRVIVKGGAWMDELRPAISQALRIRRLEQQNQLLIRRLVESKERLEERNQRLDEFSSTIAHDIRSLLASIIMRLDYVLESDAKNLPSTIRKILATALDTGGRLTEIVQATYDFARLGREAVVKREIDLRKLASDVVTDMHIEESFNIQFEIGALPVVWGNQGLLRRVLANLFSNSIKYNTKPNIKVRVYTQESCEYDGQECAQIVVEDNGVGIEAEKINKIFGIFWRDPDSTVHYEGLGVGLAVVQRIMELHDGEVRVESEVGKFTKFTLIIPIAKS